MDTLDKKLNSVYPGRVVRKDLLHRIKKGTNVPSFVLEFLLARYCASDDVDEIEAGIQAAEEGIPVVVVTQEIAAPVALADTCPSKHPFSAAFLLAPAGYGGASVRNIQITVSQETVDWPQMPESLSADFSSNMSASLLPLLSEIASNHGDSDDSTLRFPVSPFASLDILLMSPLTAESGDE